MKLEIRKIIEIVLKFMNDNREKIIELIVMLYELNEKRLYTNEKLIKKSFAKNILENSINEKLIEKSFIDNFIIQTNIIKRIKTIYLDDKVLKKLMKYKRENLKRIFSNLIKFEFRLKLKNCEIKNNLF